MSDLLVAELAGAPPEVQAKLTGLRPEEVEVRAGSEEARKLRDAYLAAGVVGSASVNDAYHVAIATVARADMLVSWNFKHLVHFEKMRGFNAVNLREGYAAIEIHSPLEVIGMKTAKVFDCVEMKNDVQARLREREKGRTDEEIEVERRRELQQGDGPVARWWRDVQAAKTQER